MFYLEHWATYSLLKKTRPEGSNWSEYKTLEEAEQALWDISSHHEEIAEDEKENPNSIYWK